MSYTTLLKMRCNLLQITETQQDGLTNMSWNVTSSNIRCFLDLNFARPGKDPVWTPETGSAQNRQGVLFLPPGLSASPGNRIQMIKGPSGTFEIQSEIDEAWTPTKLHHLECFAVEINRVLASS